MSENKCVNLSVSGDSLPTLKSDESRSLIGYEYLDHTADVQIHSWGPSVKEAFEQAAKAMFGYMTELDTIQEQGTLFSDRMSTHGT